MSALQCCELLTKSQVFQKESATIAEESQDHTYKELHDVYHASLLSHSACGQQLCILLKSQTDRILANDRACPTSTTRSNRTWRFAKKWQKRRVWVSNFRPKSSLLEGMDGNSNLRAIWK